MTYVTDLAHITWRSREQIDVRCDICQNVYQCRYKSAEKNWKKNDGKHVCMKCKGMAFRPQQSSGYWTQDKRAKQSIAIKSNEAYKQAIVQRNTKGQNNGMFGKTHSVVAKRKMSASRTGKIGPRATAWKGGKMSFTQRVKGIIHKRYNWYRRVFARDGWECRKCKSKKQLDAHHIKPVVVIIRELCSDKQFENDTARFEWVIDQPEIIDSALSNGITLCRACHKQEHQNWGSHVKP